MFLMSSQSRSVITMRNLYFYNVLFDERGFIKIKKQDVKGLNVTMDHVTLDMSGDSSYTYPTIQIESEYFSMQNTVIINCILG